LEQTGGHVVGDDVALLEVLLDASFDLSSFQQDVGVRFLLAEDVVEEHEQHQEDVLDDEENCDELQLGFG
jgi:hypothetical protein